MLGSGGLIHQDGGVSKMLQREWAALAVQGKKTISGLVKRTLDFPYAEAELEQKEVDEDEERSNPEQPMEFQDKDHEAGDYVFVKYAGKHRKHLYMGLITQLKDEEDRSSLFMGRITGSASIDTLVRVGLEKQHGLNRKSRMVVLRDFLACAEREINVQKGLEVYILYEDNEWSYVITEDAREGYVPKSFISPWKNFHKRPLTPPSHNDMTLDLTELDLGHQLQMVQYFEPQSVVSTSDSRQFKKQLYGRYVVMFDFAAADENDITLESREVVTVMNMDDPDWYWMRRGNGEEGFVPRSFICPFPSELNLS